MELKFADVVTSVTGSVHKALASMCQIVVDDHPYAEQQEVIAFMVMASNDTYSSVMKFSQKNAVPPCKGALVVYVQKTNAVALFAKTLGYTEETPIGEFADACGELCNLIMGGIKFELAHRGYGEIDIGIPHTYTRAVTELINFKVKSKCIISFSCKGFGLLSVHIAVGTENG